MGHDEQRAASGSPLISVGMPVFNGEPFLSGAIEAILDQTFGDFELIISDNASTDGTEKICKDFAARDSRIRYYRNAENIGAARNYKRLVDLARGEYFRWSNADDLFAPRLHELCLGALKSHPEAVLSYGGTELIDADGVSFDAYDDNLHIRDALASQRLPRYFRQVGLTNAIYGLMRMDAVRSTDVFGDGSLPAGDTAFMAQLLMIGSFVEVPETLFFRRMHEAASSEDRVDNDRELHFWSAGKQEHRLPVLRQTARYLRHSWKLQSSLSEKFRLTGYFLRRLAWQRSAVASELVAAVRRS